MGSRYRELFPHAVFFFIYGATVHLVLLKLCERRAYAGERTPESLSSLTVYAIVAAAGGLSVATLFLLLLRDRRNSQRAGPAGVLFRGAIFGVVATFLAVAGATVAGAAVFASHFTGYFWFGRFFLAGVNIGTYTMVVALGSVPAALLYGVLGGAYVLAVPRRGPGLVGAEGRPVNKGKLSLVLGALGVVLLPIPYAGLILGALAVVAGIWSRSWERGPRNRAFFGRSGTVLGALCIAYWVYSFFIFRVATFGWHRPR